MSRIFSWFREHQTLQLTVICYGTHTSGRLVGNRSYTTRLQTPNSVSKIATGPSSLWGIIAAEFIVPAIRASSPRSWMRSWAWIEPISKGPLRPAWRAMFGAKKAH